MRFLFLAAALAHGAQGFDPLQPLTTAEITAAVDVMKASGKIGEDALFPYVVLEEPSKAELKAFASGKAAPRVAAMTLWDNKTRISEWRVDLLKREIIGSKIIPQGQAPVLPHEYVELPGLVRKDPRWRKAMEARGITDFEGVMVDIWAAGPFLDKDQQTRRMARAISFLKAGFTNPYAHPIEVAALIDVSRREVVEVYDSGMKHVPRQKDDFDAEAVQDEPAVFGTPAPAARPSFEINGHEVSWRGWKFRYAMHPREGLVLYTVSHRGRSIMHRASLSEMVVPYADPARNWMWRNAFDVGEYGLGRMTSPQEPGLDAPAQATLLDEDLADEFGKPLHIPRAVAVYERDGGIFWRHQDALVGRTDSRRGAELVIQCIVTISNYDYLLSWVFRQDGTIVFESELTGIMLGKAVEPGAHEHAGHTGHKVAPGVSAVHHQHFFNVRLDLDVDGEYNSVAEVSMKPEPPGPKNPYGNDVRILEDVLESEKGAARDLDFATQRKWKVFQPGRKNALGQPTAYVLIPGENSKTFLTEDSPVRQKARFIDHQFWVTRLKPSENYAAGVYPNQGAPGEGLPEFISDDESLKNKDLVVWYTFGVTHVPRPEEWPVMPVHKTGFKIVPVGFHARNPAMGPQRP